jgi:hypothetical protein
VFSAITPKATTVTIVWKRCVCLFYHTLSAGTRRLRSVEEPVTF